MRRRGFEPLLVHQFPNDDSISTGNFKCQYLPIAAMSAVAVTGPMPGMASLGDRLSIDVVALVRLQVAVETLRRLS